MDVDVGACLQQQRDRPCIAEARCPDQRRVAQDVVGHIDISPGVEQDLHAIGRAESGGPGECLVAQLITHGHVRARIEQRINDLGILAARRVHQG